MKRTTLENFPQKFSNHSRSKELADLVDSITNHDAMKLGNQYIIDNMIRASLTFTMCFYGNAHASLSHYMGKMHMEGSRLAVPANTETLHLWLDLANGELATNNIPTRKGDHCPHYVPMLEAAEEAGINTSPIKEFTQQSHFHRYSIRDTCKKEGFAESLCDYLTYSDQCTKTYEDASATIALRELTLANNFSIIVQHLPADNKYSPYLNFLTSHIELDTNDHGPLMSKLLEIMS